MSSSTHCRSLVWSVFVSFSEAHFWWASHRSYDSNVMSVCPAVHKDGILIVGDFVPNRM